ncbi:MULTISPECIES: PD-(D/E)XK nuclease family protein [unclassified Adlercreutzia]|uniref:PD-(D/E)XK nuclease family protein n=1 Tax=unclassified Adlercreutzia TaxID=2636013 RepID=UPI0013EB814F|nr:MULTISPECIES: PD-(D/E)XK nuclease family protein [unclassified Adlercreutzia]
MVELCARVYLHPSFDAALAARKSCAHAEDACSLGATFTTPEAFVADLWEVWGDARRIVSAQERLVAVRAALARQDAFARTLGTARLIARFIGRSAGTHELDEALRGTFSGEDVTPHERAVLDLVRAYQAALDARGLVEMGQAARVLSDALGGELGDGLGAAGMAYRITCAPGLDMAPAVERLLAALGWEREERAPFSIPALDEGVEPGLLIPAGATATPAALLDEIMCLVGRADGGAGEDGADPVAALPGEADAATVGAKEGDAVAPRVLDVVVCAPDPRDLYRALSPHLAEAGIACGLECRVPFGATALGHAWASARALVEDDARWIAAATDFAYGAFSGMRAFEAQRLNAELRRDRLLTCADARERLRAASPSFAHFEALACGGSEEARCALDAIEALAKEAGGSSPLARPEERGALAALRGLLETARSLAAGDAFSDVVRDVAPTLSVPLSTLATAAPGSAGEQRQRDGQQAVPPQSVQAVSPSFAQPASVRFTGLPTPGSLAPKSADAVILADVTDASFPAAPGAGALDVLACKLGLPGAPDPLDGQRRAFAAASSAARRRFTCVLPLRNEAQEETYPAFAFDEYVEALAAARGGGGEPVEEGNATLPGFLARAACRFGEDVLARGMGRAFAAPAGAVELAPAHRGVLATLDLAEHLPSAVECTRRLPVLSPSAIEAYLGCPYQWFVTRRIRLNELDEGFGALETGSFAHAVLAAFYDALAARGCARVPADAAGWQEASALFDEVFDAQVAAQPAQDPAASSRLVARTEAEALAVERLREVLRESVRRQARFAPTYAVCAHELEIKPDQGVDYAGARLNGRVDRVDVDAAAGRYLVLDYKGSSERHAAGFPDDADPAAFALPRKVQALVYAQALRGRFDGLACAGALYLGYRARSDGAFAAGSFDEAALDLGGFGKDSSCVHMSFARFLDLVEEKIAPHVRALMEGRIEADPASKEACAYCPVASCERRLS